MNDDYDEMMILDDDDDNEDDNDNNNRRRAGGGSSEIASSVALFVHVAVRQPAGGPLCHAGSGLWDALAAAAPSHLADVAPIDLARLLRLAADNAAASNNNSGDLEAAVRLLLRWSEAVPVATRRELVVDCLGAEPLDLAVTLLVPLYRLHAANNNNTNTVGLQHDLRVWLTMSVSHTEAMRDAFAIALAALAADPVYRHVATFLRSEVGDVARWIVDDDNDEEEDNDIDVVIVVADDSNNNHNNSGGGE